MINYMVNVFFVKSSHSIKIGTCQPSHLIISAVCDVGQEPSGVDCSDCRIGYYSSTNSADLCEQCPGTLTTIDVASTALTDCRGKHDL